MLSPQDPKDSATLEELATLDTSVASLREVIPSLKSALKAKSTALATLRSQPTTQALKISVDNLEKQRDEIEARLKVLRSGTVKPVSMEEKERVEAEYRKWAKKELTRKRMWKEAEGTLLEAMTREELYVSCSTRYITMRYKADFGLFLNRTSLALMKSSDREPKDCR
jgi:26S proteasome regulatory subunit, ATPase 3, interacting protein